MDNITLTLSREEASALCNCLQLEVVVDPRLPRQGRQLKQVFDRLTMAYLFPPKKVVQGIDNPNDM